MASRASGPLSDCRLSAVISGLMPEPLIHSSLCVGSISSASQPSVVITSVPLSSAAATSDQPQVRRAVSSQGASQSSPRSRCKWKQLGRKVRYRSVSSLKSIRLLVEGFALVGRPSFFSAVVEKHCGEAVLNQQANGLLLAAVVINAEFVDFIEQVIAQIGRRNVRILTARFELHKKQKIVS